ncbi:hypothetical protein DL93DRAFT_2226946 [Clavulina sp. PMI_390]|nr:hypothetical protein DL93DRAFT_2226946 [Clavulina sp. PMI_390]
MLALPHLALCLTVGVVQNTPTKAGPGQSLMDKNPSTLTGEGWLHKLTFDVVEQVVQWLDPLSLLCFASTCQAFRNSFHGDRLLWTRALSRAEFEHSTAPYSFQSYYHHPDSLRRAATRPDRVYRAISKHGHTLSGRIEILTPDYDAIAAERSILGKFGRQSSLLLPGGRWLLSAAILSSESRTDSYIFCWDVLAAKRDSGAEEEKCWRPQAELVFEDMSLMNVVAELNFMAEPRIEYLKAQLAEDQKSVIVAARFKRTNTNLQPEGIYRVMQLTWDSSGKPLLLPQAMICFSHYFSDHPDFILDSNLTLMGDLVTIEDSEGIAIWNWKEDTIGFMDGHGHEWITEGDGFCTFLFPPHLYVAPAALSGVLRWEIPAFPPANSRINEHPNNPPLSSVQRALPYVQDASRILEFDFVLLDEWKSTKSSPGVVVLLSTEWGGTIGRRSENQHTIILRGDSMLAPHVILSGAAALEPMQKQLQKLRMEFQESIGEFGVIFQRAVNDDDPLLGFRLDIYPFDGARFLKTLWARSLRRAEFEHSTAPYSFHPLSPRPLALRRAATRPDRIFQSISGYGHRLTGRIERFTLEYNELVAERGLEGTFKYHSSLLLPGGRWLLTTAILDSESSTNSYIFCWDVLAATNMGAGISSGWRPRAELVFEDVTLKDVLSNPNPMEPRAEYLKAQLAEDRESILIAARSECTKTSEWFYHIIQLTWDASGNPLLSSEAKVCFSHYFDDPEVVIESELTIMGDLVLLEDSQQVAVWNWREDTFGFIDGENHEWVTGEQRLSTLLFPPHLYIAPGSLRNLLRLEIPTFPPINALNQHPLRPLSSVQQDLPYGQDAARLQDGDFVLLDEWKPTESNPGVVVLLSTEWELTVGRKIESQHTITLRSDSAPAPHITLSGAAALRPIQKRLYALRMESQESAGQFGVTFQRAHNGNGRLLEFHVKIYHFDGTKFHNSISQTMMVESKPQSEADVLPNWKCAGPPCLLSGTCLLRDLFIVRANPVVGILYVD